jgi:hypothetical protein
MIQILCKIKVYQNFVFLKYIFSKPNKKYYKKLMEAKYIFNWHYKILMKLK